MQLACVLATVAIELRRCREQRDVRQSVLVCVVTRVERVRVRDAGSSPRRGLLNGRSEQKIV